LSYLGDRFMSELPKARYLRVETFHVRPGKSEAFMSGAKMYQNAYQKLNLETPWVTYQVMSGAPEEHTWCFRR